MLGAGPPRDGIIRTSPGQECSKDKGALPGARRISVYASRSWSRARRTPSKWFTSRRLILCLVAERVSLYPAKRRCARSSMDRASDYGSEGWGFESLRARSGPPRCDPPVGVLHFYQALLRECFFHAHFVTVTVPASRLPLEPRQSSPSSVRVWLMARQSLPDMRLFGRPATKFAQHGAFSGSFAK